MATSEKIIQLKQLLAERFGSQSLPDEEKIHMTGLASVDEIGIVQATVTEIVSSGSRPGGVLLLYGLLHSAIREGSRIILIDGTDSFAPKGLPSDDLGRILWVKCANSTEALKSADLTIRDGNVPLVILWLTLNPLSELKRIPSTAWHRLQMLAEKAATTVLIFSPHPQVGCARLRLSVGGDFPLSKLHANRSELLPCVRLTVERWRIERRCHDETLRRSVRA